MYFKREIKSSKIGTKFIPALKYGAFFGFSRKKIVWCGMAFVVLGQDHKLKVFSKKTSLEKKIESTPKDH